MVLYGTTMACKNNANTVLLQSLHKRHNIPNYSYDGIMWNNKEKKRKIIMI